VLDKRCVGREESGIDVGWGVLRGHVAIGVVFRIGRGESFGAGEGWWCWCLESGGVSMILRTWLFLSFKVYHTSGKSTQNALMFSP
jgi:hypothetical protein